MEITTPKEFGPTEVTTESQPKEFGPPINTTITKSAAQKRAESYLFSSLLDVDVKAVRPAIDNDASVQLDQTATDMVESNKQVAVNLAIQNPEEDIQGQLSALQTELESIDIVKRFAQPSVIAMLTSQDPILRDYSVNRVKRLLQTQDIVQKRLASASDESFLSNYDYVDFFLSSPQNLFVAKKNQEYADKYTSLLYSNLPDEDFEVQLDSLLTEMADQGLFTEENRFYLGDFLAVAAAGSESSVAKTQELFGALDTLTSAAGVAFKAGSIAKTTKAVGTTTALSAGVLGRGALGVAQGIATDAARLVGYKTNNPVRVGEILSEARIIDDPVNAALTYGNHVSPSFATSTLSRAEYWSHTSAVAAKDFELGSQGFRTALRHTTLSGEAYDDAIVASFRDKIVTTAKQDAIDSGNRRFLDADLVKDATENLYFQQFYGTQKGDLFRGNNGRIAAQNLAEQLGGEVVAGDLPNSWKVLKTDNIPVGMAELNLSNLKLFTSTEVDDLGEGLLVEYLGSPLAQTSPRLNAILKQAEASREAWKASVVSELTEVRKFNNRAEQREVFGIFDELRDGSLSTRRTALTRKEFEVEFLSKYKKNPTEAQKAMYLKYQEALDVDAMLKADGYFKRQVADGVVVDNADGSRMVPMKSEELPANAKVWDEDTQSLVDANQFPAGTRVYRNYDPVNQDFKGDSLYKTGSSVVTRRLYHSDLLVRNAGGPRNYRQFDVQYYVKQERSKRFADGSEVRVSPLTVMGVRTEAQAAAAKLQLNTIIDAIKTKITGNFAKAEDFRLAARALSNDKTINDLIAANSKWFPDAYSVNTFLDWADEAGVDLRKQFDFVSDGEALIDSSVSGYGGMRYSDAISMQALNPRARRDKLLMSYGGTANRTYGAGASIEASLARGVAANSERAYMSAAINGLMKAAIEHNVLANTADLRNLTLKQKLRTAEISTTTSIGRKLALEQKKILFRMDQTGLGDSVWTSVMGNVSDYLYGKGFQKTADIAADLYSNNPLTALRGFVFDAKLGMFNPAQYYVQGSQAFNIMAVGGMAGVRGVSLYGPVRFAIANGNEAVIRRVGDLIQPISGLNADQFFDLVDSFRSSGRGTVGVSLAEFGSEADQASRIAGAVGEGVEAIRTKGRFFFNEGELIARISAYSTAYIEYLEKFPTGVISSQQGRRWVMNRQDILTQGMTGASRTPVERLPTTQFMSYMFRINEAIFSGTFGGKGRKVLTDAERYRLAGTHTALFGASAWGAVGFAMDAYRHYYGVEMDPEVYRALRKGLVDTLLTELTGVESSLSSRLSNSDGIFMIMQDAAEKNIIEFLGGPSIEVGWQATTTGFSVLKNLVGAHSGAEYSNPTSDDLLRFARAFSSANQAYNAYTAFKYGEVMTRDNALLDRIDNPTEAVFAAFGVPIERQEEAWKFATYKKFTKNFDEASAKGIQRLHNSYAEAYRRGDYEEAQNYAKVIAMKYSSMTPAEQERVDRLVFTPKGTSIVDDLMFQALRQESGFAE
jgi:hypothetical protein